MATALAKIHRQRRTHRRVSVGANLHPVLATMGALVHVRGEAAVGGHVLLCAWVGGGELKEAGALSLGELALANGVPGLEIHRGVDGRIIRRQAPLARRELPCCRGVPLRVLHNGVV